MLRRLSVLALLLSPVLLSGQTVFRLKSPLQVPGSASGVSVDDATGAMTLRVPVATLPGELPIPLVVRLNGSHQVIQWTEGTYSRTYGDPTWVPTAALSEDRPAWGAVHFGYINPGADYLLTPYGTHGYWQDEGALVLEDGRAYGDGDWSSWSTYNSANTFTLAADFGFTNPATSALQVTVDGAIVKYNATADQLGSWATKLTGRISGFTTQTTYCIVMDRAKARVFAYLQELNTWAPVLWVDRFGHSATFTWTRQTAGLPSGVTSVCTVVADNRRPGASAARAIQMQWATYAPDTVAHPLLRADFVGVDLPSLEVDGYTGFSALRPNGMNPPQDNGAGMIYQKLPESSPRAAGFAARPTTISVGDRANLPDPTWAILPVPSAQPNAPTLNTLTWQVAWDANHAAPLQVTDPAQLVTQVTSSIDNPLASDDTLYGDAMFRGEYIFAWRGDALTATGPSGSGHTVGHKVTWSRTFPTTTSGAGANFTVIKKDWFLTDGVGQSQRTWTLNFGPATQPQAYGNAALAAVSLADLQGKTWLSVTNTLAGTGLNNTGTLATGQVVTRDGEPAFRTLTQMDPKGLRPTGIEQQVAYAAIRRVTYTYADYLDKLDNQSVSEVVTQDIPPGKNPLSPSRVQDFEYGNIDILGQTQILELTKVTQKGTSQGDSGAYLGVALAYDAEGRRISEHPLASFVAGSDAGTGVPLTSITYDSNGWPQIQRMSAASPSLQLTTQVLSRDSSGRPLQVQDAKGVVTTYGYDLLGRLVSQSTPGQAPLTVTYSGDQRTVITAQAGRVATEERDALGRPVRLTRPDGTVVTFAYDACGRLIQRVTLPAVQDGSHPPRTATWSYDPLDRPVSETGEDGVTVTTAYSVDSTGYNWVTTAVNTATGLTSVQTRNGLGQVLATQVKQGSTLLKSSTYAYDGHGHLTQVQETDPAGAGTTQTRSFTYDGLDLLTTKTEPETGIQTFSGFNVFGRATQVSDGVRTRTLTYDGLGRLTAVSAGSESLSYTFTGPLLTQASTVSGGQTLTQAYTYGPATAGAPLVSETTQTPDFAATIQYAYAADGALHTLTYPSGRVVSYGYDALGRVTSVSQTAPGGGSGGTVATVAYDPAWGMESALQFASGASSQWTTEADGIHLKQWSIQLPNGTKLDGDRLYAYDSSKDHLSQAGEWALTHDSRGRLTGASAPALGAYGATYGYDAFDNNTSAALSGSTPPQAIGFTFGALPTNRTPATTTGGSATGWIYDAAGEATNVGASVGATPQTGLVWDGLGRLSQVNAPGLTEVEGYAPSGLRVRRDDSVAGLSRRYAYTTGGLLLGEYVPAAGGFAWNRDVIYLGSEAIAEVDGAGVHELHSDHLGTPRLITGPASGAPAVEGRQVYGPYGETFPAMDSGYQPLTGYTGHLQTDPTGLIYMRGRFYTPIWHRFVNSDQGADSSTYNQMAYVGGGPFLNFDPSGMVKVKSGAIGYYDGGYVICSDPNGCDTDTPASGWEGYASVTISVSGSGGGPFIPVPGGWPDQSGPWSGPWNHPASGVSGSPAGALSPEPRCSNLENASTALGAISITADTMHYGGEAARDLLGASGNLAKDLNIVSEVGHTAGPYAGGLGILVEGVQTWQDPHEHSVGRLALDTAVFAAAFTEVGALPAAAYFAAEFVWDHGFGKYVDYGVYMQGKNDLAQQGGGE
ncbi:MAG TPA: RHS repeat-associated core domain-containing protein, partial [Holophagaceae bacterium]|nr:RHS repeat-associated core domain-containing protein [Holophagaceae bacterium]